MGTSDWSSYVGSSDLVQALAEAVNQPGAIGIAAAGGIDHTDRVGRRNQQFALFGVDLRTAGAAGNDVRLDPLGNIARAQPRSFCPLLRARRSEEHTSELQSLMRISYAVFCLKKKNITV